MSRRLLAVVAAALLATAACSGGDDGEVVERPPTTLTTTPIRPTGAADAVRRWVAAVAQEEDDVAWSLLAPATQAVIGGREGYAAVRRELQGEWLKWGEMPGVSFDAVPVADGLAAAILHADTDDGGFHASAVPLRVDAEGDGWLVEPLLSTGDFRVVPEDGATVQSEPELAVVADAGVEVFVFVDGQRVTTAEPVPARGRAARTTFTPERPLELGWHVVAFVFRAGDQVTARAVGYLVEET